ncbi:hypothetical protein RF11_16211 [Thelohanellus kitauei]|uniref:Uncharacterized protein n=1 Tax=Thelohanellus kitauei TaxID=669202 RepID=A0A0C2J0G1_THEKT|nr:hypothetical protein RF11_16211 [Thelohanellus kitauei]
MAVNMIKTNSHIVQILSGSVIFESDVLRFVLDEALSNNTESVIRNYEPCLKADIIEEVLRTSLSQSRNSKICSDDVIDLIGTDLLDRNCVELIKPYIRRNLNHFTRNQQLVYGDQRYMECIDIDFNLKVLFIQDYGDVTQQYLKRPYYVF